MNYYDRIYDLLTEQKPTNPNANEPDHLASARTGSQGGALHTTRQGLGSAALQRSKEIGIVPLKPGQTASGRVAGRRRPGVAGDSGTLASVRAANQAGSDAATQAALNKNPHRKRTWT